MCFPVNIAKILKNTYFEEHIRTAASSTILRRINFRNFLMKLTQSFIDNNEFPKRNRLACNGIKAGMISFERNSLETEK